MIPQPRRFKFIHIMIGGLLVLVIIFIFPLISPSWNKAALHVVLSFEVKKSSLCTNSYITIRNVSISMVNLRGLRIHYAGSKTYTFSDLWLLPGTEATADISSYTSGNEANTARDEASISPDGLDYFVMMPCDALPAPPR